MNKKNLAVIAGLGFALLSGLIVSSKVEPFMSTFRNTIAGSENTGRTIHFNGDTKVSDDVANRYLTEGITALNNKYYLVCDNCATAPTSDYVGVAPITSAETPLILYISSESDGSNFGEFRKATSLLLSVSVDTNYVFYISNDSSSFVKKSNGKLIGGEVNTLSLGNAKFFKVELKGVGFVKPKISKVSIVYDCDPNFDPSVIVEEDSLSGTYKDTLCVRSLTFDVDGNGTYKYNGMEIPFTWKMGIDGKTITITGDQNDPNINSYGNGYTLLKGSDTTTAELSGDTIIVKMFGTNGPGNKTFYK